MHGLSSIKAANDRAKREDLRLQDIQTVRRYLQRQASPIPNAPNLVDTMGAFERLHGNRAFTPVNPAPVASDRGFDVVTDQA